ncbi:EpsG family protein [Candidatus Ruminimicrobium bovinum]|uniref:EpsG family protein n=1 Tax=Candidatus Ruminimicrobium bovinum TaxID=3242779 RepID=UPI0039B94A3A
MFIIERLISLSIFISSLFVCMLFLSKVKRSYCGIVLFIYLVILCIFAYFFKPNVLDLSRLHNLCLNGYGQYSWDQLKTFLKYSRVPVWHIYSWIIYHLTNDVNFIQTITCFWCFGNLFYVLGDIIKRNNINGVYRALLLFSIMSVGAFYMETISGIRSMLSFSICFLCIYREMIHRKNLLIHIPLYIFAALMHQVGTVVFIGRIISLIPLEKNYYRKTLMALSIIPLLIYAVKGDNFFLISSFNLAHEYIYNSKEYYMLEETIIGIIELCQIWYVLFFYKLYTNNKLRELWFFSFVLTIISTCAIPFSYSIFRRYTIMCSLLILPLIGTILGLSNKNIREHFSFLLLVQSILIFALSYSIGDMRFFQFLM